MPAGVPAMPPYGRLVFANPSDRSRLSRQAKAGVAVRLAPNTYVVNAGLPVDALARHHLAHIIGHFWPGAVLSGRSAWSGPAPQDGWVFVSHPEPRRRADLELSGVIVNVEVGPDHLLGDIPLPGGIYQAGIARGLVENVTARGAPPRGRPSRRAGTSAVEDRIDELARTGAADAVRAALQGLDTIAPSFDPRFVHVVRGWLRATLGTFTGRAEPSSDRLRARLAGQAYDEHRLELLRGLVSMLRERAPQTRPALPPTERWTWLPFFEAYFSNFIEGTEFGVEEARRIVVEAEVPQQRPEDAHDVAATFRLVSDPQLRQQVPADGAQLVELLRDRHAVLMAARPDESPGQLKQRPNYAGGYEFVAPELVEGTLVRGWDVLAGLTIPLHRAAALMFLLTECHPFDDGNGRVARLLANATLSAPGEVRIVIPTSFRDNYLVALRAISNHAGRGESLLAVLDFAQRWASRVDWTSFESANADVAASHGYEDPAVAEASGRRLRLP